MHNFTTEPQYPDWSAFRAMFFKPTEKYTNIVDTHIEAMERLISVLHLGFLPFGIRGKLYREPYGFWKEGTLPSRFSIPMFMERTNQLYECLQTNHGCKKPKSLYLLGWPQLLSILAHLESLGFKVNKDYINGFLSKHWEMFQKFQMCSSIAMNIIGQSMSPKKKSAVCIQYIAGKSTGWKKVKTYTSNLVMNC